MSWLRDLMIIAGITSVGVGLYFYDWRLALIGVGGIAVLVGILSAIRAQEG